MNKDLSILSKNIRITTNQNSKSKEKQIFHLNNLKMTLKTKNSQETQNFSISDKSSTTFTLEKLKCDKKSRNPSIFFGNKERKCLIIASKQNCLVKKESFESKKLLQNFSQKKFKILEKNIPLRQLFCRRSSKQQEQEQLPTPRQLVQKSQDFKMNYKIQDEFFKKDFIFNQQFQNSFLNYKRQCQKLFTQKNFSSFQIQRQFQISINQPIQKNDYFTQTSSFTPEDKYFSQYAKYRQLKQRNFKNFNNRQQQINNILKNSEDFETNYGLLLNLINEGPEDDRQKRVLGLSKDLTNQQTNIGQAFQKINDLSKKFQQIIEKNIYKIVHKKISLLTSITHLVESTLIYSKNNNIISQQKFSRILQRVKNQLVRLKKFTFDTGDYGVSVFKQYHHQISNLQKQYDIYTKYSLQNRVLLYNCVKQIQKIPTLMVMLFGFDKQADQCSELSGDQQKICRFKDYMATKCQQCFNTQNKIKLLQFHNQRIMPVLKSIEWLIRDTSKHNSCFQIL